MTWGVQAHSAQFPKYSCLATLETFVHNPFGNQDVIPGSCGSPIGPMSYLPIYVEHLKLQQKPGVVH